MSDEKFVWKGAVLWHANDDVVAGWVSRIATTQIWYARTAGTLERPTVRAEFDNRESAEDFLMFIANSENTYD
jgi:hypothetical protein